MLNEHVIQHLLQIGLIGKSFKESLRNFLN